MTTQDFAPSCAEFKAIFRRMPSGVAVITTDAGSGPVGFTASSVTSVGLAPPTVIFSLMAGSSSAEAVAVAETMVVHFLRVDHRDLAIRFAARGVERFPDDGSWARLPSGAPFLVSVSDRLRVRPVQRLPVAGALLVIAEVVEVTMADESAFAATETLAYLDGAFRRIGSEA